MAEPTEIADLVKRMRDAVPLIREAADALEAAERQLQAAGIALDWSTRHATGQRKGGDDE